MSYYKNRNRNFPYHSNERFEQLMKEIPVSYTGKGNAFGQLLDDLQANIIRHHRKNKAIHIFIHFKEGKQKAAIEWLDKIADEENGILTSAKKQLEDRKADVSSFSLTAAGFAYFGLLEVAPKKSENPAFWQGFEGRTALPKDYMDSSFHPAVKGQSKEIHAMLMYASDDEGAFATTHGLKEIADVKIQPGFIRYEKGTNGVKKPRGWFGYKDGISTPYFFPSKKVKSIHAKNLAPLGTILVKDHGAKELSAGSFLSILKLEQDVQAFEERADKLEAKINGNKSLAKAMMMGRFLDGTPITSSRQERPSMDQRNYDYESEYIKKRLEHINDKEGVRCPFISHTRKANPRNNSGDYEKRKIVRRGVQYDDRSGKEKSNAKPDKNVGMLFLSFQKNIQNQFEYILNKRMLKKATDGVFASLDAIMGHSEMDYFYFPSEWNSKNKVAVKFEKPCVKLKDGLYLYAPSLTFLRRVKNYSSHGFKKDSKNNGFGKNNAFLLKPAKPLKLA